MPSSRAACLLVLLGAVLASGSPVLSPVEFVPGKLRHAHEIVADQLELKVPQIGTNPIFGAVVRSINASCERHYKVQLVNATVDVYMRIFSSILRQGASSLTSRLPEAQRQGVEAALGELRSYVETLRGRLNRVGHDREDPLDRLTRVKVDDPVVQRKALAELLQVYQAASVVVPTRSR